MQTFTIPTIPQIDPGQPPVSAAVRADRAARLRRVEDLWLDIKHGHGTPVQRAVASVGFCALALHEEPGLLLDEPPAGG